MSDEDDSGWKRLEGDLRSALQARDWGRAGEAAWALRRIDADRYARELEDYTRDHAHNQSSTGGDVALESEQRAAALADWLREEYGQRSDLEQLRSNINYLNSLAMGMPANAAGGRPPSQHVGPHASWYSKDSERKYTLIDYHRDVVWSVVQELRARLAELEQE